MAAEEEQPAKEPTGLIIFDLDGFKQYNDRYGHPVGDALLGPAWPSASQDAVQGYRPGIPFGRRRVLRDRLGQGGAS